MGMTVQYYTLYDVVMSRSVRRSGVHFLRRTSSKPPLLCFLFLPGLSIDQSLETIGYIHDWNNICWTYILGNIQFQVVLISECIVGMKRFIGHVCTMSLLNHVTATRNCRNHITRQHITWSYTVHHLVRSCSLIDDRAVECYMVDILTQFNDVCAGNSSVIQESKLLPLPAKKTTTHSWSVIGSGYCITARFCNLTMLNNILFVNCYS